MNEKLALIMSYMQSGNLFAPIIFIMFHIIRQPLFIPVVVICIAGGLLFGPIYGTAYSLIGLTLSNVCFYLLIGKFPKTRDKLIGLKDKIFGNRKLNTSQIAILRLIPFIHYYLLSFCLLETNRGLKKYIYLSFLTNIPLAVLYTIFGHSITGFSSTVIIIILFIICISLYLVREKQNVVPWKKFFHDKDNV